MLILDKTPRIYRSISAKFYPGRSSAAKLSPSQTCRFPLNAVQHDPGCLILADLITLGRTRIMFILWSSITTSTSILNQMPSVNTMVWYVICVLIALALWLATRVAHWLIRWAAILLTFFLLKRLVYTNILEGVARYVPNAR